jgi:hypothetical protein
VDDFVAAAPAEQGFEVFRAVAGKDGGVGAGIGGEAAADALAADGEDVDGVAAFEIAGDGFDAGREQGRTFEQRPFRAGVDGDGAQRREVAGDPVFAGAAALRGRQEPGAFRTFGDRADRVAMRAATSLVRMPPEE